MRPLTLQETANAMGGRIRGQIRRPCVRAISTDSRNVPAEALFFAIKGPNHDGHAFVNEALQKGAAAAVLSHISGVDPAALASGRIIEVQDTVAALGRLAAWYRRQFAAQVIAVLGSNGKTTVKNMIAAVLGSVMSGQSAPASFNNAIGVPLTLLSVEAADEFVVVEIGTNHPGEVAALAKIAGPDVAVVTSISEEHLEFLGDVAGVAQEEFSFLPFLEQRGFVAVSDQAAAHTPRRIRSAGDERRANYAPLTWVTFGFDRAADLRACNVVQERARVRFSVNERFEYELSLLGTHNVSNALAAIAVGTRFRLSHSQIAAALANFKPPPMRLQRSQVGNLVVINDAYNANPSSMKAAFEAVGAIVGARRKVFILGDMRELGEAAARCHREVGVEAGRSTANSIISVGIYSRNIADGATATAGTSKRIYAYPNIESLSKKLPSLLEPGDLVLLKASRGVQLERIIPFIEKSPAARLRSAAQKSNRKSPATSLQE